MVHHADSVTLDPHKQGVVPYNAGCILYKNHKLKNHLKFSGPYIYDGKSPDMTFYGTGGSKAGLASAGVYLSHKLLPLDRDNHG